MIGHRKAERDLIVFSYNKETKQYESEVIDHDCGPANVAHYVKNGTDIIISANRETDEVAMYTISK